MQLEISSLPDPGTGCLSASAMMSCSDCRAIGQGPASWCRCSHRLPAGPNPPPAPASLSDKAGRALPPLLFWSAAVAAGASLLLMLLQAWRAPCLSAHASAAMHSRLACSCAMRVRSAAAAASAALAACAARDLSASCRCSRSILSAACLASSPFKAVLTDCNSSRQHGAM